MLANHPHIAATLAAAHRADLEREIRASRLRRLVRATRRRDRSAPGAPVPTASDPLAAPARPAPVPTGVADLSDDVALTPLSEPLVPAVEAAASAHN